MAEQHHRATAEHWDLIGRMCHRAEFSCLVELRDRIEALEREAAMNELRAASAEARPTVNARITRGRDETGDYLIIHDASPSTGSLVERVAAAMHPTIDAGPPYLPSPRAVIREVAAWMSQESSGHLGSGKHWARRLHQEAER